MKKKSLLVLVALFIAVASFAQQGKREYSGFFDSYYYKGIRNLNFTLNGGLAFYRGDLCDACLKPNPSFRLGVNYKIWPRVSFGAEFHYLKLSSDDKIAERGISFTSTNLEFIGYGRFYLVDDIVRVAADRTRPQKFVKSYIMAGIGVVNYSPTSTYNVDTTNILMPAKYRIPEAGGGTGFIVPVGLGLSWKISNRVSLLTEVGYRITFTDYLDNVSLRGNPGKNDGYAVLDFKLQFSPWAPKKKKPVKTTPPAQYDGPKGTETWKNKKPEEPVRKNTYEEVPVEETPQEENVEEKAPEEEYLEEETPKEGEEVK